MSKKRNRCADFIRGPAALEEYRLANPNLSVGRPFDYLNSSGGRGRPSRPSGLDWEMTRRFEWLLESQRPQEAYVLGKATRRSIRLPDVGPDYQRPEFHP